MKGIEFRVWHKKERKMYFRGYQKLFYVLLCEDDHGKNDGKGIPLEKGAFEDCVLLQSTGLEDKNGKEIFEGDIVRITSKDKAFTDVVGSVPDMFKSRGLHPIHDLLKGQGLSGEEEFKIEVLGNQYQSPEWLGHDQD